MGQPQADYAAEILQASHKMEEYCGSLIDYAKTFQIDSNQFSQLSLGDFLADSRGTIGHCSANRKAIVFISKKIVILV